MDTIKKIANAILDAGEGCQSGLVYVDPVEAAKAAISVLETPMVTEKMIEAAQKAVNTRHGLTDEEMRKALEAALSADAEPVDRPKFTKNADGSFTVTGGVFENNAELSSFIDAGLKNEDFEPRAAPPAPSVAVKALEWKEDGKYLRARMGDREYSLNITADGETWAGCTRPYAFGWNLTWISVPNCSMVSLESAKAACQADCQSRYAALSAQVQDVAGELSRINEMMDEGDDDGSPILPEFEDGWSVEAKVEACLHLLEKRRDVIEGFAAKENWRDDPAQDERWNAGLDFAMAQLCKVLKVDPQSINWDCATETLEGDAQSQIHKVLAAAPAAKLEGKP